MSTVVDYFGSMVFDDRVMKKALSEDIYQSLKKTINEGAKLDEKVASEVANAMKDWAVSKGATHFTHWFQPMTGITAEKHDSFIIPSNDGGVILEFSGKELIKGESDASSFPSGGLRATFEARGYTAWDPTSYAFIKGKTLCIPTAFCSYGTQALDKKTPLLRSMQAINKQALRILRLFGNTETKHVHTSVGAEQEYFLIDKDLFKQRKDLTFTGRTLFGSKPPKGQEMDDHYYGAIKPRVAAFMEELDVELWKLGIYAKTEHNEVAPSQHELASIYTTTNIATDQNQLMMEIMQKVASNHNMVCLLHEKPFAGVNGSGKHNNWSINTDNGFNLLTPGETPYENAQFLLVLCAVIKAVDDYQDLLRLSVASAGNDHRLGSSEAPPAIISMFLGDELNEILNAIENDIPYNGTEKTQMKLGVSVLPKFVRDTTDRNRTSPFAYTGNKFEFRMVGSSDSIACANIMINAAVAQSLKIYADRLENAENFETTLHEMIRKTIKDHKRIIFNGNGYNDEWVKEATQIRGLLDLRTTPDCIPYYLEQKNIDMLSSLKILSETEIRSRYEILMENYCKTVNIEGLTMVDMSRKEIMPAIDNYISDLLFTVKNRQKVLAAVKCEYEIKLINKLTDLLDAINEETESLEIELKKVTEIEDITESANYIRDHVLKIMSQLRLKCDEAENCTAEKYWPFPTYEKLLFGVK